MEINDLLRCTLQILGRAVMPSEKIRKIIGEKKKKQIKAFNLCDGTRMVTEIAKESRINQGNLSRTLSRWCESGIVFRIGEGKDAKFLHIYPLAKKEIPKA
jgi:DNA-binding HxlR family transcriptional regulator